MSNSSQQYQIKQQYIEKYFLALCHPSATKKDFSEVFKTFKQEQQDSSIQLSIDDGYQLNDGKQTETNLLNEAIKGVLLSEVKSKQKLKTALALLDFIVNHKPNIHKKLDDGHDYNSMTSLFAIVCSNQQLFFSNNKKLKSIYNKIKQINETTDNPELSPLQFKSDLLFYENNNGFNINYSLLLFDIYQSTNSHDPIYQKQITDTLVDYHNQHLSDFIAYIQDDLSNSTKNNKNNNNEQIDIVSLNSQFIVKGSVQELHDHDHSFYYLNDQINNRTNETVHGNETQQKIVDFYLNNIQKNQLLKEFQSQHNIKFSTQNNNRIFETMLMAFQNGASFNAKQQNRIQLLINQEKQLITKWAKENSKERKIITLNQLEQFMLQYSIKYSDANDKNNHHLPYQLSNKRKPL